MVNLNITKLSLTRFILNPKRIVFLAISTVILAGFLLVSSENKVSAATGINRTINFQGKVVNSNGTNVADGQYTFVFRIYNVSSGGVHLWTETQNNVQVTAGVFRVALGSVTSISGVDFNTDNIYLGINFNSDGEMTPRVRFASVPYAFNAEKVAGLTVTNTTGTFTLTDGKTLTVNNTLTFGGTDGTSFTLPNSSGTIVTLDASQSLTNKSIGSTGLTFSGASTDILTGTDESLTIAANGTGNVLIQSQSGGQAAFIVDKTGSGDILAASASGITKFVIKNDGTASSAAGFTVDGIGSLQSTNNQTLTVGGGSTGNLIIGRTSQTITIPGFDCSALGNGGKLTTTSGGVLTCSADTSGGAGGDNFWQYNSSTGIVANGNLTTDLLLGSTATATAKFAFLNMAQARGNQVASISGKLVLDAAGSLQTTKNQTLTLGGDTTGDIALSPRNGSGTVTVNGTLAAKTSGTATIVVAASDTSAKGKLQADYVSDGTDDDATIETAITALPSTGGSVILLDGTYSIGDAAGDGIDITKSNVTLQGAGSSTILQRQGDTASNDGVITIGDGGTTTVNNILIENLSIDGQSGSFTGAQNIGIYINRKVNQSKISKVWIYSNDGDGINIDNLSGTDISISQSIIHTNTVDGIVTSNSTSTNISDNIIYSNTGDGIQLGTSSNNSTITGNNIYSNGANGILATTASNVVITGNSIRSNTSDGIVITAQYAAISGNNILSNANGITVNSNFSQITGNQLLSNSSVSINIAGGSNTHTISGNNINTSGSHGIALGANVNNVVINSNVISGVGASSDGINLAGNVDSNIITDNRIIDASGSNFGINVTATTDDNNYIAGNYITGAGFSRLVSDSGSNTTIAQRDQFEIEGSNPGKALLTLDQQNSSFNILTASASGVTRMILDTTGRIGLGTIAPEALLHINGGNYGGNSALIINQTGASTNDLFTASASGTTKFRITNNGTASSAAGFTVDGVGSLQSTNNQSLTIGSGSTGELTIGRTSQRVFLPGFDCSALGNGGKLTTTSGGILTCSADTSGGAGGSSNWVLTSANGTLNPINNTLDILVGGTTTQSAMFSVLGIAAGTNPSASVSATQGANAGKGIYISGDGSLQSVNMNTLTIGGANTGNILFKPNNSSTSLFLPANGGAGLGTTNLLATLDVRANLTNGGTQPVASFSGKTSYATLVVDNSDNGDIIAASSSGLQRFTVHQNGNVLIGTGSAVEHLTLNGGNFLQTANSNPTLKGTVSLTTANTVAVSGKYAYVGSLTSNSVKVIDISNPTSPVVIGTITDSTNLGTLRAIAVSGNYVYAAKSNRLSIIDVSNPATPTFTGTLSDSRIPSPVGNIYVSGKNVYLGGNNSLTVVDVSNSSSPIVSSSISLTNANGVYVFGKYAYIAGSNYLSVVDISNPNSLTVISTLSDPTNLASSEDVYVSGRYAYVASDGTNDRLSIVDISNPYAPLLVGSISDTRYTDGISRVIVSGKYAYVTANTAKRFTVIDISDPTKPGIIGTINDASNLNGVTDLAVAGKYAYVTAQSGNIFATFDISGIDAPTATIGNISSNNIFVSENVDIGNNLYIGSGLNVGASGIFASGSINLQSTVSAQLNVSGTNLGQAIAIFNQTSTNDILAASASGVTKFVIKNDGTASSSAGFTIDGVGSLQSTNNQSLTIGSGSTGELTIGRTSQRVFLPGFDCSGSGNGGKLTTTAGGVLTCSADTAGGGGGSSNWVLTSANGTLNPINNTLDILVGGTTTQSAMFSVLGIAAGTNPSASVSATQGANAGKGIYISGDGSLQSVNMNTLTIGGATTGNILFKPNNSSTSLFLPANGGAGLGTTNLLATLDVRANLTNGGTQPVASFSGKTSFAALAVDNSGLGDIFTASSSGLKRFTVQQNGNVLIGTGSAATDKLTVIGGNVSIKSDDPTHVGSITDSGSAELAGAIDVFVSGKYAYVAGNTDNGVEILDISNPATPTHVGSINDSASSALAFASSIYVAGKYAYVTSLTEGVEILDITDPTNPKHVGTIPNTAENLITSAYDISVSGKYAYVVSSTSDSLVVIDISDPTNPKKVGAITDNGTTELNGARGIYVSGKYAYVAAYDDHGVEIINISDPTNPTHVGAISDNGSTTLNSAFQIYVSGKYAYVTSFGESGLEILDISDPSNPTHIGTITDSGPTELAGASGLSVSGNYAYIASQTDDGVEILDISNPSNPTHAGAITDGGTTALRSATGLYVSGKYAYVAGFGDSGVEILDISGIDAPAARIGNISSNSILVSESVEIGNNLSIGNGLNVGQGGIFANSAISLQSTQSAQLYISGTYKGQALVILNQQGTNDIVAASSSGITKFVIKNDGTASSAAGFTVDGVGSIQSTNNQSFTIGGGSTGELTIGRSSQRVFLPGFDCSALGNGGKLTTTSGGVLTCSADLGNTSIPAFDTDSGAIMPGNTTLDTLLGGTSSTSAAFKVTGQGNPFKGTLVAASVSANTSFAGFVIDQKGVGDVFTASTSGVTQLVLTNGGALGLGLGNGGIPTAKLDVNGNASISGVLAFRTGAGSIQTTAGNTLTLGGSTTGDIAFKPGNASTPTLYLASNGAIGFNGSFGSTQNCLVSNGSSSAPTWGNCATGAGNWWNLNDAQGTIYPVNTTLDMLWGGTTTASATFKLSGATSNQGTVAAASVSARTSFAGLVVDNTVGDLFTASSSGLTRFVITQNGGIGVGTNTVGSGLKLDVVGSVRFGTTSTATPDDIVKSTTNEFTITGSTANNVTTTNDKITLKIDNTASIVNPAAGPLLPTPISTFSAAMRRQDGKIFIVTGNGVSTRIYDQDLSSFIPGPDLKTSVASNAAVFQRGDGKFVIALSNTSNIYDPSGVNDFGSITSGPSLPSAVASGARTIALPTGNTLLILGGRIKNTALYNATTNTFSVGPLTTSNVASGSAVFQRPDGKWVLILGDGSNGTNIFDPTTNNGGGFSVGPNLNTGIAQIGAHVFQMSDGRFMVINGGNTSTTNIYDPLTNTFSAGPTLVGNAGVGAHSIQRPDGKWIVVLGGGTNATNLYDPTSGADGTFTRPANSDLTFSAGVGALTFQRDDGKYIVVSGSPARTNSSTTVFDGGWNMSGLWESEAINNTKISTYSAMIWRATPQFNVSSGSAGIVFKVRTAPSSALLSTAEYRTIQSSGDLIQAGSMSTYLQIRAEFNSGMVTNYLQLFPYTVQSNIWNGDGGVSYYRNFLKPTIFNLRIQNPIYGYGGIFNSDAVGGRNGATQSAILDGVISDNTNRLTLAINRLTTAATPSAGVIIASASANLGGNLGAGAVTLQRPDNKYLIILAGGLGTTRMYDPVLNSFSAGPSLAASATTTTGTVALMRPDGNFLVCLGGTTSCQIYDSYANLFYAGPSLQAGNLGAGAHAVMRSDGKFLIFHGGNTTITSIYDPLLNSMTAGPFTNATNPINTGAHSLRRNDGRIVTFGSATTIASYYDQDSNSFQVGAGIGNIGAGGMGYQLPNGDWIDYRGTTVVSTFNSNTSQETAGTAITALAAGAHIIPMPDGKQLIINGNGTATQIMTSNFTTGNITGPVLPVTAIAGAHSFQLPNGKYMLLNGNASANTTVIDVGWNLQGTYITEPINAPQLSSNTALFWKNAGGGNISAKYRTAASEAALGVASWIDFEKDDGTLVPAPGDTWVQLKFDMQAVMPPQPYEKQRVWSSDSGGGATQYYRKPAVPVLQYWRLSNNTDPNILTLTNGGTNTYRFQSDGQAFTSNGGAWNSGGADLAERYSSNEDLVAAEVVTQDKFNSTHARRTTTPYDPNILGVVSTQPGFIAGAYTENSYPIALIGRVPVKISTENGQIKAGDYLTSASIPGFAMKATVSGKVIGQAMENFDPDNSNQTLDCPSIALGSLITTKCGIITVFVNITSYTGDPVELHLNNTAFDIDKKSLPVIPGINYESNKVALNQQRILEFLKQQKDQDQQIYTDRLYATQEVISPQIITDLLIAKKIKAQSIEGLEILVGDAIKVSEASTSATTSFIDELLSINQSQNELKSTMASMSAKLEKLGSINILGIASQKNDTDLVMVNNFASYGNVTLAETSILNTLTIGTGNTLSITQNSIDTFGEDLAIQSFQQGGVSFMSGAIKFDKSGKAFFADDALFEKNVEIKGNLTANTLVGSKLQLSKGKTQIISDTEVTSTAAAGLVTLKKNNDHVKINNPLIEDNSFIFITPKSKTKHRLYLIDQIEESSDKNGSFTVGIESETDEDINFNYLIIN